MHTHTCSSQTESTVFKFIQDMILPNNSGIQYYYYYHTQNLQCAESHESVVAHCKHKLPDSHVNFELIQKQSMLND